MTFSILFEHDENDDRWIAAIVAFPGVLAYGDIAEEATTGVQTLALRVLASQ